MSQFSTNESISLEKRIDLQSNAIKTNPEDINRIYEIEKCVKFIEEHSYNKVCLQFPDYLLVDSVDVVQNLEQKLNRKVYVLGDTAYESCCIDFTSAKHISADCIIHFGAVCFSAPENIIPHLKIYEKYEIDINALNKCVYDKFPDLKCVVLLDTPYLHKKEQIQEKLIDFRVISIENIDELTKNDSIVYVGQNDRKLMNIYLQFRPNDLYFFDPKSSSTILNYIQDTKIIKRRLYLAEKIKDSQTIGIVLSTLAVANYLQILDRTINLIKLHAKKYYVLSVGKPNVAKLANFPEIDVFVVIGCAMNEIYENRDFFKPLVTVFDLEIALNSNLPPGNTFTYNFNDILANEVTVDADTSDVSLITGKIRNKNNLTEISDETDNKLVARSEGKLALCDNYGAGFLSGRSWQGLEQDLGKTDVKLATKGRKGIALSYDNETK